MPENVPSLVFADSRLAALPITVVTKLSRSVLPRLWDEMSEATQLISRQKVSICDGFGGSCVIVTSLGNIPQFDCNIVVNKLRALVQSGSVDIVGLLENQPTMHHNASISLLDTLFPSWARRESPEERSKSL